MLGKISHWFSAILTHRVRQQKNASRHPNQDCLPIDTVQATLHTLIKMISTTELTPAVGAK